MGKQQDEQKKQDYIESQLVETQPMAESAGSTKASAEALGVDAEKRHNQSLYEQYQKQESRQRNLGNKEGADQLKKLKDEVREKAGIPDPEIAEQERKAKLEEKKIK